MNQTKKNMHNKKLNYSKKIFALLFTVFFATSSAFPFGIINAASVQPTPADDNPTCADFGYQFGFKVDPEDDITFDGTYDVDSVGTVTIDNTNVEKGQFDWTSSFGIDAVIVKGGPVVNRYIYDPPAESLGDTSLVTQTNPHNDKPYGLSHVSFCYDTETPEPFCGDGNLDDGEQCDDGNTADGDGCSANCTIEQEECIPEGESGAVIPDGPECCEGLDEIGCEVPDQSGNCPTEPCVGAFYCTNCGNGICGLGENKCNCPEDCEEEELVTIIAQKVVCQTEADLPNWGDGGPNITSTTAQDFISGNQNCQFAANWSFEWASAENSNPGDNIIGQAGGNWTTFGTTDSNGQVSTTIDDLTGIGDRIWLREVMKEGYIPFSGDTTAPRDNVSAELYCHEDVLNYDNYDYILNPQLENTYYCVAFNALTQPPQPVCGNGVLEAGEQCDDGNTNNGDGCSATCTTETPGPYCELTLTKDDNEDPVEPGDQIIYHLTLENTGTADCTGTGVRIKDVFDSNTTYVSASSTPETIASDYIQWNVGTLHPGNKTEIDLTMQVSEQTQCGTILENKVQYWSNQTNWSTFVIEETTVVCQPTPFCGDDNLDTGEQCDDGNTQSGDGCSSTCTIEEEPPVCDPEQELVLNGGFESPVVVASQKWDIFNTSQLSSWIVEWATSEPSYQTTPRPIDAYLELQRGVNGWLAQGGEQHAELDSDWDGPAGSLSNEPASARIYQDISTIPGKNYTINFYFSPRPGTGETDNQLEFGWDGDIKATLSGSGESNTNWTEHTYEFTATASTTRLQFTDKGISNSLGTFLDTVSVRCKSAPGPICGNGILENGEQCDDGNIQSGDGCSATCTIETPGPVCGDGSLDSGEQCDDGNTQNGDGCSSTCTIEPTTIYAYKVVCESEEDLPNWGNGSGPALIDVDTAINYVNNSEGKCSLVSGWEFEWAYDGDVSAPAGDLIGSGGTGWNSFNTQTASSTPADIIFTDLQGASMIWVKENLKQGYVPFSDSTAEPYDNVSAEMYCHNDILNYDNYDYISNPQLGNTYYCVGFNSLASDTQPITIYGIVFEDLNGNGTQDPGEPGIENVLVTLDGAATSTTNSSGAYTFLVATDGSHEVVETDKPGYSSTTPNTVNINTTFGNSYEINFGDKKISGPFCGDGHLDDGEGCDNGAQNGQACSASCNSSCSYCSNTCTLVTLQGGGCGGGGYYCGDGSLNFGEQCDDRNNQNGDGCSASCTIEIAGCNKDLDAMIVMDVSGSMGYEVPTRLSLAKIAANNFLGNLRSEDQSGLVSFSWTAALNKSLSNQHGLTQSAINGLIASGATNISDAINRANLELISANADPEALKVQILLTDGRANRPNGDGSIENPNDVALTIAKSLEAANNRIIIFTIGLGNSINTEMLQTVATNTGGQYYFAPTASDLDRVFNQIASEACNYEFKLPALTVYNETIESVSGNNVTVSWYTNIPATSRVVFGVQPVLSPGSAPDYGYAFSTPETDTTNKAIFHLVTINNLIPNTNYYWRGISHASPDEVLGKESTFSTLIAGTPETPETPETPIISEIPTEGETPGATEIPEITVEEGPGMLSGLMAAVGNVFEGNNLCLILFLLILILIALLGLTLYRSRKKESRITILSIILLILIIFYRRMCWWNYWWIIIIIAVIVGVVSYYLGDKKDKGKQATIDFLK